MTTIISCPQCGAAYDVVDAASVRGRKVRCMGCSAVWRVQDGHVADPHSDAVAAMRAAIAIPATVRLTQGMIGSDNDKAEAPPVVGSAAPAFTVAVAAAAATEAMPTFDRLEANTAATSLPRSNGHGPATGGSPMSASIERRRQARRQSGFDDVEAALATLQSGTIGQGSNLPQSEFFDASSAGRRAATVAVSPRANSVGVTRFDNALESETDEHGLAPAAERFDVESRGNRGATTLGWIAFVAAIAGFSALAYIDRQTVVRILPGSAAAYAAIGAPVNSRGLEFTGVDTQWQIDPRGRPVLSITGQVRNVTRQPLVVPSVVFAFLDSDGLELFDWATPVRASALSPGQTVPFTSIVPAPPDAVRNVEIRFAKSRR